MTEQRLSCEAVKLAEAGWPVFPVTVATKAPRTRHGHLDATTEVAWVHKMAHQFDAPGGGIATPTGNGLLVIDVDPRHGGKVQDWMPETLVTATQHDGYHLYYKVDEDLPSRAGILGPGLDIKSRGGYVVLPPSPGYRWLSDGPRARIRAADLQTRFVEMPGASKGSYRLPPEDWYRGCIHDQVVAWAAYFAGQFDDADDVTTAVWAMVDQARAAGVRIDNARDHIGSAIRWVLRREAANGLAS